MSDTISLLDHTLYSVTPRDRALSITQGQLDRLRALQDQLKRSECVLLDMGDEKDEEEPGSSGRLQLFQDIAGGAILTGKYVGAVSFRGTRVTIGSRFDGAGQYFLQYLLERCWNVSSLLLPAGLEDTRQWEIYDWLLTCRLAMQLQTAWRKGTLRAYRSAEFYDSRVRGQLDIPRHLRLNAGLDDGRAAYRTREYSPDNPYNRLLLQAFQAAGRQYPQLVRRLLQTFPACRTALVSLRRQIPGWEGDRPRSLLEKTRRKINHPVYRDYESVRLTARAVLRRMGQDLQGADEAAGVLLDIDKLWEELLAKTLLAGVPELERQKPLEILGGCREIRPDFLLPDTVVDAKYRWAWGETLNTSHWDNNVREDVFQVLSYMLLLNRPNGAVVFPVPTPAPVSSFPVSVQRPDLRFWRVPYWVPSDAESYFQFRQSMEQRARDLRTQLFETI